MAISSRKSIHLASRNTRAFVTGLWWLTASSSIIISRFRPVCAWVVPPSTVFHHNGSGSSSSSSSVTRLAMSSSSGSTSGWSSWSELQSLSLQTTTGAALAQDESLRASGRGEAHVTNKLRLFDTATDDSTTTPPPPLPRLTFYRDQAGWCPYCEKTVLLIEEKRIPIRIETVPMRSYGDKPREFMQMVPNGLLPALTVDLDDEGLRTQTITESQVIMEVLDKWHPEKDGYKPMLPAEGTADRKRFDKLARLERELFSYWCTFTFRPESGPMSGGGFNLGSIFNMDNDNDKKERSPSFNGFVDCLGQVDAELASTPGPWFLGGSFDYPTMIDFVYISHVERMLASCAYWKGYQIRGQFPALDAWLDAFDRRESYLAFKSDFYTNVMDIPPQYGPAYVGGDAKTQPGYERAIDGSGSSSSWRLPLSHDDALQPLYRGPPLPTCVLRANSLLSEDYSNDEHAMARACRHMAGWKLASNGSAVAKFAARGGAGGANNPRKTFAAPLADPYANPDASVLPVVEAILQVVAAALLEEDSNDNDVSTTHEQVLVDRGYRQAIVDHITSADKKTKTKDIVASLAYLRDRIGVPRDLPLAAARHLRAHLNWAIDVVESV